MAAEDDPGHGPRTYPEGGSFPGVIGRTAADSTPAWAEPVRPPSRAPNVLVVMLDDTGFADLGCYGSGIDTPTFDRLADGGLRYRRFHTTTVCAPSRACLLTGRNQHDVAMGQLPNHPHGYPGYSSRISREHGFVSEILRERGYATYAIGKWHLTPYGETAAGSQRTHWPLGRGFDRYYGFLRGATSQWVPDLAYDNHLVPPPRSPQEGYHLNEDLADKAIEFISDLRVVDSDRPFFMYYCTGATHMPHHVPQEWADRYAGHFDLGWDHYREEVFNRQVESGVVPEGTILPPRPDMIPAWEDLDADRRQLYARQMEVYAGFLSHTDHHIGRVISFLEETGDLDNTIVMITSDNGASSDGGPHGRGNQAHIIRDMGGGSHQALQGSGLDDDAVAEQQRLIDKWGGPETYPHYSWGWAWTGNTPLRRWKRFLHEGGVSDPLIVHWPDGFSSRGEVRDQYAHITDITPTILDAVSVDPPREINGVAQSPIYGVSFAHTFDDPDAATRKALQYYEFLASRALWADGWKAVAEQRQGVSMDDATLADQQWELYHVAEDFSESRDLAEQHPDKLRELIERWWVEAGRHQVLPLDAGREPVDLTRSKRQVYYPGSVPLPTPAAIALLGRPHVITADIIRDTNADEGVLLAHGDSTWGGYSLYVQKNRLHYVNSYLGVDSDHICSDTEIPAGPATAGLEFIKTGERQGVAVLRIDGKEIGRGEVRRVMPSYFLLHNSLRCGYDSDLPITPDYSPPFRFTGKIRQVVVEVDATSPVGRSG